MRLALTTLTALLTTTGCLHHGYSSSDDDTSGPGGTTSHPPVASGAYQVDSRIDITVEALLPQPVAEIVVTARDFSTNPAHTLITLADEAGVPAVGTLREYLPDYLEGKLEGWINDEIEKLTINGVPVTDVAASFAALAETSLTNISLKSELTIAGGMATHRLTVLDLSPTGIDKQFTLGDLPGDVVSANTTATSTRDKVSIGDHTYSLAYGQYAWEAIEAACTAEYGGGIRATLGAAVNCPNVASSVASKCVWGVCVGHAAELTSICERGLDEVVERIHDKFEAMKFDAIHFAAGNATVTSTGLAGGVWTAEINAGQGLRHVPATFTATR
ncbi:MAG: hypothetical protein H0T46_29790 [Deltaproteobacteria bacterium]|nr:hypothetical protein [Deltaproteobacteria bacterium]